MNSVLCCIVCPQGKEPGCGGRGDFPLLVPYPCAAGLCSYAKFVPESARTRTTPHRARIVKKLVIIRTGIPTKIRTSIVRTRRAAVKNRVQRNPKIQLVRTALVLKQAHTGEGH